MSRDVNVQEAQIMEHISNNVSGFVEGDVGIERPSVVTFIAPGAERSLITGTVCFPSSTFHVPGQRDHPDDPEVKLNGASSTTATSNTTDSQAVHTARVINTRHSSATTTPFGSISALLRPGAFHIDPPELTQARQHDAHLETNNIFLTEGDYYDGASITSDENGDTNNDLNRRDESQCQYIFDPLDGQNFIIPQAVLMDEASVTSLQAGEYNSPRSTRDHRSQTVQSSSVDIYRDLGVSLSSNYIEEGKRKRLRRQRQFRCTAIWLLVVVCTALVVGLVLAMLQIMQREDHRNEEMMEHSDGKGKRPPPSMPASTTTNTTVQSNSSFVNSTSDDDFALINSTYYNNTIPFE